MIYKIKLRLYQCTCVPGLKEVSPRLPGTVYACVGAGDMGGIMEVLVPTTTLHHKSYITFFPIYKFTIHSFEHTSLEEVLLEDSISGVVGFVADAVHEE